MVRSSVLALVVCAPSITFGATIELFDQVYRVQTFDMATAVTWEDESPLLGGPVRLTSVEGTHYRGDNRLLFTSQHLDSFGAAANQIIQARLETDDCNNVTGLRYDATIWTNDPVINLTDYEPSGVTINTGNTGFGAGGNIVFSDDESESLHDVDINTGAEINGQIFTAPFNEDLEDLAYVPSNDQIYTLNQGPPSLVRFSPEGVFLGSFPIGAASNPAATGEPKGVTFVAGSQQTPASIRRADGTMMVALEEGGVALQVFETDGDELALEPLTDGAGAPLLPGGVQTFQIASVAFDDATGRIFLTNEGDYDPFSDTAFDNFFWVLTPAIPGDGNSDGQVSGADYTIWADNFGATGAGFEQGDFNNDGSVTGADYTIWADNFGQCGPGGSSPSAVPEPATWSLALVAGAILLWRGQRRTSISR